MRRLAEVLVRGLIAIVIILAAATVMTARSGDPALWPPPPGGPAVEIHVVSHGYHSGIIVMRAPANEAASRQGSAAMLAVTQRFAAYNWLEIGWGDEGFYRSVPDVASVTVHEAARALLLPGNPSVLHVVGLLSDPRASFPRSDMVRIGLSPAGFSRMLGGIDASFARAADGSAIDDAGPGLYGPSRFFRAVETFNIFNVCNHWVARLLSAAGLPTAPVLATMPQGLLLDLKWRAGIDVLPLAPAKGRL